MAAVKAVCGEAQVCLKAERGKVMGWSQENKMMQSSLEKKQEALNVFKCTLDVFQIQSANTPTVGRRWRLWVKIVKYQREWGLYLVNHHSKWYGLSFLREDGGTDVRERKKILRVEEKCRKKEGCTRTGDQMLQAPEIWLNFWKGQIAKCEMRDGAVPVSKRWKPDWLNASEIIRFFRWGGGGFGTVAVPKCEMVISEFSNMIRRKKKEKKNEWTDSIPGTTVFYFNIFKVLFGFWLHSVEM